MDYPLIDADGHFIELGPLGGRRGDFGFGRGEGYERAFRCRTGFGQRHGFEQQLRRQCIRLCLRAARQ